MVIRQFDEFKPERVYLHFNCVLLRFATDNDLEQTNIEYGFYPVA